MLLQQCGDLFADCVEIFGQVDSQSVLRDTDAAYAVQRQQRRRYAAFDFQQGLISGHASMLLLHQRDAEGFQYRLNMICDGVAIGTGEQQTRRLA
jgi:hypothetical protein